MALWILVVLSVVAGLDCGQSVSVSSGKFKCTVQTTNHVIVMPTVQLLGVWR